jgi:RND family efflux transporter MFP subunit
MPTVDIKTDRIARVGGGTDVPQPATGRDEARARPDIGRGILRGIASLFLTLGAVALAGWVGWQMWQAYMAAPWTRDGVVRVYVVTMAPEVAGRIVRLSVADNQLVHKGDELFEIDPTDYRIALAQAQAQLERDTAALDYARETEQRKAALTSSGVVTKDTFEQVTSLLHQAEAAVAADRAAVEKAQVNLGRTEVRSPVNGYVTNLLARLGDYANVGQNKVSVVDADSYWIDGYFEESNFAHIHEGDPAVAKLMGYRQLVRGHVGSFARAINVPNAQPDQAGLASVNPIFTWVRLAQRVPVRIVLDQVPDSVRLVAGMTATVEIQPPTAAAAPADGRAR